VKKIKEPACSYVCACVLCSVCTRGAELQLYSSQCSLHQRCRTASVLFPVFAAPEVQTCSCSQCSRVSLDLPMRKNIEQNSTDSNNIRNRSNIRRHKTSSGSSRVVNKEDKEKRTRAKVKRKESK
jgi:hypothetical protein